MTFRANDIATVVVVLMPYYVLQADLSFVSANNSYQVYTDRRMGEIPRCLARRHGLKSKSSATGNRTPVSSVKARYPNL